jgi:hypothetical protein
MFLTISLNFLYFTSGPLFAEFLFFLRRFLFFAFSAAFFYSSVSYIGGSVV